MRQPIASALPALSLVAFFASATALFGQGITVQQQQAAQAQGWANSAAYNSGYGGTPGQENRAISGAMRDPNGNLMIVNGIMSGASSYSQQEGMRQTGVGGTGASATAIGNNLNVVVNGAWNTVIVNSQQTNNGDQKAATSLNGELKF